MLWTCGALHLIRPCLLHAGLTKPANQPLWLAGFTNGQGNGFVPQGFMSSPDFVTLASIKVCA